MAEGILGLPLSAQDVGQPGGVAAQGSDNKLSIGQRVKQFKAASYGVINPAVTPVLTGQFTPDSDTVLIDVTPNFRVIEPFGCHVGVYLFTGPTGIGQLTPATLAGLTGAFPDGRGVNKFRLGAVAPFAGGGGGRIPLTGLTPGTPVAFEVAVVVIGYASALALPAGPTSIAIAKTAPNTWTSIQQPGDYTSYQIIAVSSGNNVSIIRVDHAVSYKDILVGSCALDQPSTLVNGIGSFGTGFGRCRITPDASKVVLTGGIFSNGVGVVTTNAASGTAPTKQGTYLLPNAASTPTSYGLAIDPAGTIAYICITAGPDLGKVYPMTIATGAFGAAIDLGQGSAASGYAAVVDSTGTYLYVALLMGTGASPTGARVVRVKLSDNTVTALTLSSSAGALARSLAFAPDGATLYVGGLSAAAISRIWKIRTSDFTNQGTINLTCGDFVEGIGVFNDGAGLIAVTSGTAGSTSQGAIGNQVHQHFTPGGGEYTTWRNSLGGNSNNSPAHDVAVGPNGAMYITDNSHNLLNIWFGGQAWNPADDDFWMAETRVRVIGAQ